MKHLLLTLLLLFFISGCGGDSFKSDKKIVGGVEIANFSAKEIAKKAKEYGYINKEFFGYKAYRVVYDTTDDNGKKVKASGVIVIPNANGASDSVKDKLKVMQSEGFALAIDCHGTIFTNKEAPSVAIANSKEPYGSEVLLSGYGGFITLLPDYIGFGESKEHYHPYLLKKSSANSVKDFVEAAIDFANKNLIELAPNRDMFVTGYSQGGYVALASLGALEDSFSYNIDLVAPMDGPYLLEPFGKELVDLKTFKAPSYVAYLCYSYAKAYNKSITKLIKEPYASKLDKLFDKKHTKEEIDKALTTKMQGANGLLSDDIVENYDLSWFRLKLLRNSALSLHSCIAKVKLIHCRGDDVVPFKVATLTKKAMKAFYTDVELITLEDEIKSKDLNHIECAIPAYVYTTNLFIKRRKELLGY